MTACVLDASFTFQWLFADEASPEGYAALGAVKAAGATVPSLWALEVTNVLGLAERRGRVDARGLRRALGLLGSLPLTVAAPASLGGTGPVLDLMRQHRLTADDATCLELAIRLHLPLATKDRDLIAAAPAAGVPLFAMVP